MLAQRAEVAELQKSYPGLVLLHGTELNIDPDVDWDAGFLSGFDVCVASVHSHFTQDQDAMTRRLVRACENPHVHASGTPPPAASAAARPWTPTGTRCSAPPPAPAPRWRSTASPTASTCPPT